jgi:hypothetical protein
MYINIFIYIYTRVYVYIYIYLYVFILIYIYIYIFIYRDTAPQQSKDMIMGRPLNMGKHGSVLDSTPKHVCTYIYLYMCTYLCVY